jgi:hypothetical protein
VSYFIEQRCVRTHASKRLAYCVSEDTSTVQQENKRASAHNFDSLRHLVATFKEWPLKWISGVKLWGRMMIKLVIDVVLFSCMFAFVTGVVLAATHVLG